MNNKKILINGGKKLYGKVKIESSKNSYLPIMASAILTKDKVTLLSPPDISDVDNMCEILQNLGVKIKKNAQKIEILADFLENTEISAELASKLRSSIFMLGAIISRKKIAKIAKPGGCEIGTRPIDIHIKGLKALGVKIVEKHGYVYANASALHAGDVFLDFPSVGATENLIMASVLCPGKTRLYGVAKEPEIVDLANFLNSLGAKITGAGSDKIEIEGVLKLHGASFKPIPDRIVAGTYMIACAMCGGEIELENVKIDDNLLLISKLQEAGVSVLLKDGIVTVKSDGKLKALKKLETSPYPALPTDLQSLLLAMQTISSGSCMIIEKIFENRFKVVGELLKMDANIEVYKNVAVVMGKEKLYGAEVYGCDLRATASLILAGLVAEGYTTVHGIEYLNRGYDDIVGKLQALGADIQVVE